MKVFPLHQEHNEKDDDDDDDTRALRRTRMQFPPSLRRGRCSLDTAFVFVFVFFALSIDTVAGGDCSGVTPPDVTNAETPTVFLDQIAAYVCSSGYSWNTDTVVETIVCRENNTWPDLAGNCVQAANSNSSIFDDCVDSEFVKPENSVSAGSLEGKLHLYTCAENLGFVSNASWVMTECIRNNWTVIHDICETADVAVANQRDCSEVSLLGHNMSRIYQITPSGVSDGNCIYAWCDLTEVDGNWTVIFRMVYSNYWYQLNQGLEAYTNGFYLSQHVFWIGTENLYHLMQSRGGNSQPKVLRVVMIDSSGKHYHATYDNFNIGDNSTNYSLLSLGKFHGNAGDSLTPQVGAEFTCNTRLYCFWVDQEAYRNDNTSVAYLMEYPSTWPTVTRDAGKTLVKAFMEIRYQDYDQANACPTAIVHNPVDSTETLSFGRSRDVGAVITYSCLEYLFFEGVPGGKRTKEGNATCERKDDGTLAWSYIPVFPCTLVCPDGFVAGNKSNKCYHFSPEPSQSLTHAATMCSLKNSTLAILKNVTDLLTHGMDGVSYLTAYIRRGTYIYAITPSLSELDTAGFSCNSTISQCSEVGDNTCAIVKNDGTYVISDCDTPGYHYICMLPGECPTRFSLFDGLCLYYHSTTTLTNHVSSLRVCNYYGAALLWPNTVLQAQAMITIGLGRRLKYVPLGMHNSSNDWTFFGTYAPTEDLLTRIDSSNVTGPFLSLDTTSMDLVFLNRSDRTNAYICQYPGPLGCLDPELPSPNMTVHYTVLTLSTTATYTCFPGYFMDEEATVTSVAAKCMGQFGMNAQGWNLNPNPCSPVEVCEVQNATSEGMVVTPHDGNASLLLNGTVTYDCPSRMVTSTDIFSQNLTCIVYSGGGGNGLNGKFGTSPAAPAQCSKCGDLPVPPANSTVHKSGGTYSINDTTLINCTYNYEFALGNRIQTVTCQPDGWNDVSLLPCLPVCPLAPPSVTSGHQMSAPNLTTNVIGTVLTYTCNPGTLLLTSEDLPIVTTSVDVTCDSKHEWIPDRSDLICYTGCLEDPPDLVDHGNSTWDGISRLEQAQVSYTCDPGYALADNNVTMTVTCTGGKWTNHEPEFFICSKLCATGPPAGPARTTSDWDSQSRWEGTVVTFTCSEERTTLSGTTSTSTTCDGTNWSPVDTEFECVDLCPDPPPVVPMGSESTFDENNASHRLWGASVNYTCTDNLFVTGDESQLVTCTDGAWTPIEVPKCQVCENPEPPPPDHGKSDFDGDRHWGSVINYTCPETFVTGDVSLNATCNEGSWEPPEVPACKGQNLTKCHKDMRPKAEHRGAKHPAKLEWAKPLAYKNL
ncbi:uncharacterized protein LOC143032601 [Oratosquilla oratoria]|uniref:uncharacterized protein LOC143032601 n=1 Tax=Oratosquilla oratoria TaxID=337810 RepID=UPI003F76C15B